VQSSKNRRPPADDLYTSLSLFGGHKAVVRPVPIPNTAVKHSLANGSGLIDSARVGCRQFLFLGANSAWCSLKIEMCDKLRAPLDSGR
jgi:hypothetical protein